VAAACEAMRRRRYPSWSRCCGVSLVLIAVGYASIAILDPIAARRGEAAPHLARLRPPQMGIALIGLIGLILHRGAMAMPL
jgi:hypothetical protein